MDAGRDTIPILIVSDCEPDPRETTFGQPDRWIGFERYFEFLSGQRARIAARTGVPARFSWFWRLDPQIAGTYGSIDWAVRTYVRQIAEAKRHGDESGVHVHVWRWDHSIGRWVGDYADGAWVESCARGAIDEYAHAFGEPCRLFRFGDGWHSQAAANLVERLGIEIDLTLEPGIPALRSLVATELTTAGLPDRRGMPTRPYRPTPGNYLAADPEHRSPMWMLPMTTGEAVGARAAPDAPPVVQLNLGFEPEQFAPIFERAMAEGPRPFAAVSVRTDVGANEGLMRRLERNLQDMLDHPLAGRFAFMTPSAALPLLTAA